MKITALKSFAVLSLLVGGTTLIHSQSYFHKSNQASAAELTSIAGPSGGYGGSSFSWGNSSVIARATRVSRVVVRSGNRIDAIRFEYQNRDGSFGTLSAGGQGGSECFLILAEGEYITQITGRYGAEIDSIRIVTNRGNSRTCGGGGGRENFAYSAPQGQAIWGIFGREGRRIDALGVFYGPIIN